MGPREGLCRQPAELDALHGYGLATASAGGLSKRRLTARQIGRSRGLRSGDLGERRYMSIPLNPQVSKSLYLYLYISISLGFYISIPTCIFISLCMYIYIYMCIYIYILISIYPSIYLPTFESIYISICICIALALRLGSSCSEI